MINIVPPRYSLRDIELSLAVAETQTMLEAERLKVSFTEYIVGMIFKGSIEFDQLDFSTLKNIVALHIAGVMMINGSELGNINNARFIARTLNEFIENNSEGTAEHGYEPKNFHFHSYDYDYTARKTNEWIRDSIPEEDFSRDLVFKVGKAQSLSAFLPDDIKRYFGLLDVYEKP